MGFRELRPITIGIAGVAGTGGIGIMVSRLAAGQDGSAGICLLLAASFFATGLMAALGLVLDYRLERLALRDQAATAHRELDLRVTQLELQRAILEKIPDGTKAAQAYHRMTMADVLRRNLGREGPPVGDKKLFVICRVWIPACFQRARWLARCAAFVNQVMLVVMGSSWT